MLGEQVGQLGREEVVFLLGGLIFGLQVFGGGKARTILDKAIKTFVVSYWQIERGVNL